MLCGLRKKKNVKHPRLSGSSRNKEIKVIKLFFYISSCAHCTVHCCGGAINDKSLFYIIMTLHKNIRI